MRPAWFGIVAGSATLAGVALLAAGPREAPSEAGSLARLDVVTRVASEPRRDPAARVSTQPRAVRQKARRAVPRIARRSARIAEVRRRARRVPVRVHVPSLGIHARVVRAGVRKGALELPRDTRRVAWHRHGARPGEPGTALLAAHADLDGRPGVLAGLRGLEPGARVAVRMRGGRLERFRVVARRRYAKRDLPARLFRRHGPRLLALVTCGGRFDERTRTYESNTVVYAVRIGR